MCKTEDLGNGAILQVAFYGPPYTGTKELVIH